MLEMEQMRNEERKPRCPKCGIPFKKLIYLKRHVCKDVKNTVFKCICNKVLSTKWNLKVHQKLCDKAIKHNLTLNEISPPKETTKLNESKQKTFLEIKFEKDNDYSMILEPLSNQVKYKAKRLYGKVPCPICNKTMYVTNISRHHISCKKSMYKIYKCPICLKRFSSMKSKKNHVKYVHKTKLSYRKINS